jgi:LuxR family maltose regulon positive regulatory protein
MPPGTRRPAPVPRRKIAVPELPQGFVPRPSLLAHLDGAAATQLVLVSAPAGAGKTLLLADWARSRPDRDTAWVSLDSDDNDPRRLWAAVTTALMTHTTPSRKDRLQALAQSGATHDHGEDVPDLLADALDDADPPGRLVLDDVHELTGPAVLRDLGRLVQRSPAGVQVVLASRADPPFSLPRLRLEGRLHEVRAEVLRFSVTDAATLLTASGLQLSDAQVERLHTRTEGWAAGLRLAALALRRTDDPDGFLTDFSGDERSVADYLTGEVLDGMRPEARELLQQVSICSSVPAMLAAELSGRDDADRVLDELCRETALLQRTAPGEYRVHSLLRSYLTADLVRHRTAMSSRLHAGAARWWSAQHEPVHALRHALRADDPALLADLLRRTGVGLLLAGELGALRRGLATLGPVARRADPWLALLAAIAHLEERALPAAVEAMREARQVWPATADPALEALLASADLLAAGQGRPGGPLPVPRGSAEGTRPEVEALLRASRGMAALSDATGADLDQARSELQLALEFARAEQLGYLEVHTLSALATLAAVLGEHGSMISLAEETVSAAIRHGRHPSAWSADAMAMLAYADLLAGDPAAAQARSAEALSTGEPLPPESAYTLHAVHGAALADRGARAAGLAELRAARLEFGQTAAPPSMRAALAVLEHRVALLQGNVAAAAEARQSLDRWVGETGETVLMRAWADVAAGRGDAGRVLAARLRQPGLPVLLPSTSLEAHLVEAEAALQEEDQRAGDAALDAALAEGEALGVLRPFALAGPRTRDLMSARVAGNGTGPFTRRVTAARAAVNGEAATLLSEREAAVLALLPSLLSAAEIAAEFTVSVNTVKSHIRSIYAKLGVSSRRDAVLQARDRGLLT